MSVTQDVNGKESSKRFWAKRFFLIGQWFFIVTFFVWSLTIVFGFDFELPQPLIDMWIWMMGFASAVILGTIFEKPKDKPIDNDPLEGVD